MRFGKLAIGTAGCVALLWAGGTFGLTALTQRTLDDWAGQTGGTVGSVRPEPRLLSAQTRITDLDSGWQNGLTVHLGQAEVTWPFAHPKSGWLTLSGPLSIDGNWGTGTLTAEDLRLGVGLDSFVSTALDWVELHIGGAVFDPFGLSLDQLDLRTALMPLRPDVDIGEARYYAVDLAAAGLTLPDVIKDQLDPAAEQPATLDTLVIKGQVRLNPPVQLVTSAPLRIEGLSLDDFSFVWGNMALTGKGTLTIHDNGIPQGEVLLTLTGGDQVVDMIAALGLINPDTTDGFKAMLKGASNADGVASLPIRLEKGLMYIGMLPIGPAPIFAQRQ